MRILEQSLRVLDGMAVSAGFRGVPLDADELCARALRNAGRTHYCDASFMAPLRLLLECYEKEADLNLLGRHGAKWDVLRCLSNLLRFDAAEQQDGAIANEKIERPIFITGFPRSGTTLLHSLLADDATFQAPRCYQTIFPYPARRRDTRRRNVERQLRMFQNLAPEMAAMHPLSADDPQECTEITAQVFQSLRYEMTHRVPSYQRWLDGTGHLTAYRFHKRFLQHLQHQQGQRRWVLKSPDHVHAVDAIEATYPDCGIVFVHRDPLRVAASAMKLTEVVRRPFTRRLDKAEIGGQVLRRLMEAAEMAVATGSSARSRRIFHLQHARFAADPLVAIGEFYRHFDIEVTRQARERLTAELAHVPRTNNHYSFEEFGLDPLDICSRFEFYMDHFEVQRESAIWKKSRRTRTSVAA